MTRIITRTGNDRSYMVATGYQDRSRHGGKLLPMERPEGEPSMVVGISVVAILALIGAVLWVMLP